MEGFQPEEAAFVDGFPKQRFSSSPSISAISAAAEQARARANQEPNQGGYNAVWLHGYAQALADAAEQLEPQQQLIDAIVGYMGEQNDSAHLYAVLHDTLEMSEQEILSLGFDLPQLQEAPQHEKSGQKKKRGDRHER